MKIGTKSLLFGCHQFLWHPLTVALAYRKLFRRWPDAVGFLCIALHDVGYWGCADIDGPEGKLHPVVGAKWVGRIVYRWRRMFCRESKLASQLYAAESAERCLLHSRSVAMQTKMQPSDICWADKYVVCVEPEWFYLFRTWLSGEAKEFVDNAVKSGNLPEGTTNLQWHRWYCAKVKSSAEVLFLRENNTAFRQHLLLRYSPCVLKGWINQFEKENREPVACTHTSAQHVS